MAATKIRDSQVGVILEILNKEMDESEWRVHVELRERVFPSRSMYLRIRQMDDVLVQRCRNFAFKSKAQESEKNIEQ